MALSHSPSIVLSNLVFCVDSANVKSYPGTGATWTDISTSGNNVTLVNTPTFLSTNSGVLDFNGSTQYGSFAGAANNFGVGSIECWCQSDAPTDSLNQQIVARTNTTSGTLNILKNSTNQFQFNIRLSTGTQYTIPSDSSATTDWTHIIGTYDGTTQKIYVNGVHQTTTTSISGTIDTAGTLDINIGRNTTAAAYFNGRIPVVRLYNRALTTSEVQQNFNALRGRFGI
jgi:hypothetical protein